MGLCDDIGEVQLQMDGNKEKIIEKIRRIIIMDMCYDGTLVMPSSYAVMDEDEMSYVEGGLSTYWTGVAIDIAISILVSTISGGATAFFKGLASKYGTKRAGLHFGNMAAQYTAKYIGWSAATALSAIAGVAFNVLLYVTCPGMKLAEYWAVHDKNRSTKDTIEL